MTDFLHYIFPGAPVSKEKQIADEIIAALKGGEGSGNFGHAGRPGEVGGSGPGNDGGSGKNEIVGQAHDDRSGKDFDVYKIDNASDIIKYDTIAVNYKNGEILASDLPAEHSFLVEVAHPGENVNIDSYVRFRPAPAGGLNVFSYYSGVVVNNASDESRAIDNIYKALDKMVAKGFPEDTRINIYTRFNPAGRIVTTAKEFIEDYS